MSAKSDTMNESRIMSQVSAVFGAFMTVFYIGIGIFFILTDQLNIDKFVKGLFGFTFTLYGVYRGFRTWQKLREAFSGRGEINDEDKDEIFGSL